MRFRRRAWSAPCTGPSLTSRGNTSGFPEMDTPGTVVVVDTLLGDEVVFLSPVARQAT